MAPLRFDNSEHLFYTRPQLEQMFQIVTEGAMAQRRDPLDSTAFRARAWIPFALLLAVLFFVVPGIPASLTLAAGASSVVLLAVLVGHSANGSGRGSDEA